MKKRVRSVMASTLITALVAMTPTAVIADTADTKANATINVYVDGYYVPSDVPPMIDNDRVFIPMRAAAEAMGAIVEWDNITRSVSAQKGDISAYFLVGSKIYTVNDEEKTNDVAPQIVGNRTMLPIRVFAESFGADVEWDDENRCVLIHSGTSSEPESPDIENPDETYPPVIVPEYPEVNPPVVEPEYPEVDPPEEKPAVDERENLYKQALNLLRNGDSYQAYYIFESLGNYKNCPSLKEDAYWLNQISFNHHQMIYTGLFGNDWYLNYPEMTEQQIRDILVQGGWVEPGVQSASYELLNYHADGTVYYKQIPSGTNNYPEWNQGKWYISLNSLAWRTEDELIASGIYRMSFRKLTDDLYINVTVDQNLEGIVNPGPSSATMIRQGSNIAEGYINYFHRSSSGEFTGFPVKDNNGLWYIK